MPEEELALVVKAICSGVSGCCEWEGREAERVHCDKELDGLKPEVIKELLRKFVLGGGRVTQLPERRSHFSHREYYYKANVPAKDLKHGLFVEFELSDSDPDLPVVTLLNAHPQKK